MSTTALYFEQRLSKNISKCSQIQSPSKLMNMTKSLNKNPCSLHMIAMRVCWSGKAMSSSSMIGRMTWSATEIFHSICNKWFYSLRPGFFWHTGFRRALLTAGPNSFLIPSLTFPYAEQGVRSFSFPFFQIFSSTDTWKCLHATKLTFSRIHKFD